jgi:F-type H+-transporting ATPase subunit epsilon
MVKIKVLSPSGVVYDSDVAHVTFPGAIGRFSVYPMHAPIVSSLIKGDIVCFSIDEEETVFPIQSGFVDVKNDEATVCVELLNELNPDMNHA